jgi:putative DNA primase/helicase
MGDFLCQLIERPLMQGRASGRSDLINVPNSAFMMANGNNLTIDVDAVRRVVQSALDADMEAPENRTFTRNPVAEVLADRGRYVGAVLTIARAYRVAGLPGQLPPRTSFEHCRLLCVILSCGSVGPIPSGQSRGSARKIQYAMRCSPW